MTNEEIVLEIQNGNREKILDLWEHTERFIAMKARKYIENSSFSMEWAEDLTQAGYFALVNAAADYDPERGASFIHYLTFHLQNAFREALGIKTEKQEGDPIHHAAGLDTPITDREGDSFTLADIYGADDPGIEDAEHEVYVEELRAILFREIAALPEDQADYRAKQREYQSRRRQENAQARTERNAQTETQRKEARQRSQARANAELEAKAGAGDHFAKMLLARRAGNIREYWAEFAAYEIEYAESIGYPSKRTVNGISVYLPDFAEQVIQEAKEGNCLFLRMD